MPKLNIEIFGVCVVTPSPDHNQYEHRGKSREVSVLTPCAPRARMASDCETQIDALFTFLYVPEQNIDKNDRCFRRPDYNYEDRPAKDADGKPVPHPHVFILHREYINVASDPGGGVTDVVGDFAGDKPVKNVSSDANWACHFDEFNQKPIRVKPGCLSVPGDAVDPKLCVRMVVRSGQISSAFPCEVVGPTEIVKADRKVLRYFAQRIVLTMSFDEDVKYVILRCQSFDRAGEDDLESARPIKLRFVEGRDIDVVFACSGLATIGDLFKGKCSSRHDHGSKTDFEFEAMYGLLDLGPCELRPVPSTSGAEGTQIDCVPAKAGHG